jgi:hypothetical protein
VYGVDGKGHRYIEVKVYKQRSVYGHIVVNLRDGDVKLFCRECHRWYVVMVRPDDIAVLQEVVSPVPEEASDSENP